MELQKEEEFSLYINGDTEQKILSRFLDKPDDINLYPNLKVDHFLFDKHKTIFENMIKLNAEGKDFSARKLLKEDPDYIASLCGICLKSVEKHVKALIDDSDKYNTLVKLKELLQRSNEDSKIDIFSELSAISTRDFIEGQDSSADAMLKELEEKMKTGIIGIQTGIENLDHHMNGFQIGRFYVVAARSGMGKSAFMCSLIERMCLKHRVGVISLEMLASELKQRIACIRGNITHWKIEKGKCSDSEFNDYASSLYSLQNLVISDTGGMNCAQILSLVKQMVKKSKCEIVFIDHLGLIQLDGRANVTYEIGKVTALLKSLAKELHIPIVSLCQINRSVEKESDKRPKLSDLRDSGRIEEDADCVILLYRDGYYSRESQKTEPVQYIVAKCRNGIRGVIDGMFTGDIMKFE